jgi:hypothetical protein
MHGVGIYEHEAKELSVRPKGKPFCLHGIQVDRLTGCILVDGELLSDVSSNERHQEAEEKAYFYHVKLVIFFYTGAWTIS